MNSVHGTVTELTLVVVTPRKNFSQIAASYAMQRTRGNANNFFPLKCCDFFRMANVFVGSVTQSMVISFSPDEKKKEKNYNNANTNDTNNTNFLIDD